MNGKSLFIAGSLLTFVLFQNGNGHNLRRDGSKFFTLLPSKPAAAA